MIDGERTALHPTTAGATSPRGRSTTIDGPGDWFLTGLVRGAFAGASTPVVAAVVALPVAMLWPREPLSPGTTTSTSADSSLLGFLAATVYVALLLMIVCSIGTAVGAAIGVAAGGVGAGVDSATRRRLPPLLIGWIVLAVVFGAAMTAALVLLARDPNSETSGDAVVLALVALPFVLSAIGLAAVPLRRAVPSGSALADKIECVDRVDWPAESAG